MNKTAVKNFAVWARRELSKQLRRKALLCGISEQGESAAAKRACGETLSTAGKLRLLSRIADAGYDRTIEDIACTWFIRFCALRFMEVNGYLPGLIRIFTDGRGALPPGFPAEENLLETEKPDLEKVQHLKKEGRSGELFKYLLITRCNALNAILPVMFHLVTPEEELLFPDQLLGEDGVMIRMVNDIPESCWQGAVQIVGWLYQYYNSEAKDQVFADLKNNIKISREKIPAATQLFTPDWIVRYMVENSLGRIFVNARTGRQSGSESQRRNAEKSIAERLGWKYFLPEAEQTPEDRKELERRSFSCDPENLKVIDPCMGSGHILVYIFDLLMQIYREHGYDDSAAAAGIVSRNLFGLDIDERAARLAYFAVMMKARQYDSGFFGRNISPGIYAVAESNHISADAAAHFCEGAPELSREFRRLLREMRDGGKYGSILNVSSADFGAMYARLEQMRHSSPEAAAAAAELTPVIQCGELLAQKYDAVVTNPPFMGARNMNVELNRFIKENYADYRYDFFAAFMVKCSSMAKADGYLGFFVPYVWMFIHSYEKLRSFIYEHKTIETLIQFEYSAFEEAAVPVCALTLSNRYFSKKGCYIRLVDFKGGMEVQREKTLEAINCPGCGFYFERSVEKFARLPGAPAAYWSSDRFLALFDNGKLEDMAVPRQGLATGCNDIFTRLWYECDQNTLCLTARSRQEAKASGCRWFPYNKGGEFRKWYGNNDFVVNWENDGAQIRSFQSETEKLRSRPQNMDHYFKECITWSKISSGTIAFRYKPQGHIFDVAGTSVFAPPRDLQYLHGFCNSKVTQAIAKVISPTMNYEVGHIASLPVIVDEARKKEVIALVRRNIALSQADWDSFETSWNFVRHPLAVSPRERAECTSPSAEMSLISARFKLWQRQCEKRFNELKANEETLNRIFIDIYGLQDELVPEVEEKDITLRKADAARDIRSFISYAVGCMLGRYSPGSEGIVYAGGPWDLSLYSASLIAEDNIIPICDDEEYCKNDLAGRFTDFVRYMYGAETLEENLAFIAQAIGGRGSPRAVIRKYLRDAFFADHCTVYRKRPIYWLFDSGKKGGFRALVYMHRFAPETLEQMLTGHLPDQENQYRAAGGVLSMKIHLASGSEKMKLVKQQAWVEAQLKELCAYKKKLRLFAQKKTAIEPDDGVKKNYALFGELTAKIK